MQVIKMIMVGTGTYNDVYRRNYTPNFNEKNVNMLHERTQGGAEINSHLIGDFANEMLAPSVQPTGDVMIPNGWDTPRLRFVMVVRADIYNGYVDHIISGYTDYIGVTPQMAVDPAMRLYFNSIYVINQIPQPGGGLLPTVMSANHILRNDIVDAYGNMLPPPHQGAVQAPTMHTMRPEDVFASIGIHRQYGDQSNQLIDFRSSLDQSIKLSQRSNANPSDYIAKTLSGYKNSLQLVDDGVMYNNDQNSPAYIRQTSLAKQECRETSPRKMDALTYINEASLNDTAYFIRGYITYGELAQATGNLDHVCKIRLSDPGVQRVPQAQRGDSEHWHGANHETTTAVLISTSVPTIMNDSGLTSVTFYFTNDCINGQWDFRLLNAQSIVGEMVDITSLMQRFEHQMRSGFLNQLTFSNQQLITMTVYIDLINDAKIDLSINRQPMVTYRPPNFCDALNVPVVAPSDQQLKRIGADIEQVAVSMPAFQNPNLTPPHYR